MPLMQSSATRKDLVVSPLPLEKSTSPLILSPTRISNLEHQLRREGLDKPVVESYIISNRTSINGFACDQPHASLSLKTFLAAVVTIPQGLNLATKPPLLRMIAAAGN